VLGYDVDPGGGRLVVNEAEAERVRAIFALFEQYGSVLQTLEEIERLGSPHAARRLMAVDGGSQPRARPSAESLRKLTPERKQSKAVFRSTHISDTTGTAALALGDDVL